MLKIKYWIDAMRLRTLPLSVSGIIVGSGMAGTLDKWDTLIFLFAILTTISFQVLSNFSNDLGDSQKGSDNNNRIGPKRTVQAGLISGKEMQIGIIICSILALLFAGSLIYISAKNLSEELIYFYVGLALSCVLSAITYTIGKRAYGYSGFGDLMVFLFFGLAIDPVTIISVIPIALVLAVVGIIGKLAVGYVIGKDMQSRDTWKRIGAYLIPRGEFSIVIAALAVSTSFGEELKSITIAYVIITTLIASLILRYFRSSFELTK